MTPFLGTLLGGFLAAELLALAALQAGERLAETSERVRAIGRRAHDRKLRAVETVWPLTRLPGAIARRDLTAATFILVPLVLLKSALMVPFGLIALVWLPVAAVLVPAIDRAHGERDEGRRRWVMAVGRLQVTSHVAAAAVGFAVTLHGPLAGRPIGDLLAGHWLPVALLLMVSAVMGVVAARREAEGVVLAGYLDGAAGFNRTERA